MSTQLRLGMIPAWQFSLDPAVNPKINPFVKYPDGVYQTTPQSWGPWYPNGSGAGVAGPRIKLLGPPALGGVFDSWWWTNRKWVALGGVGLLGGAVLVGLTAILR